jgi:hypothetical protein
MSVFTIGRCEFEEGPTTIDQSGSIVTLSGDFWCDTYAELTARRFQLLGMVNNPDEDVFPLFSTDGALEYLNGFYRVLDASVGSTTTMSEAPTVPYTITLEAVGVTCVQEITTNAFQRHPSLTPTDFDIGAYLTDRHVLVGALQSFTSFTREWEGGVNATIIRGNPFTLPALPASLSLTYSRPPQSFYDGMCRVEIQGDDSAWYTLVGREVPPWAAGRWRITNGITRLRPAETIGNLVYEVYASSGWEGYEFSGVSYRGGTYHDDPLASATAGTLRWVVPAIVENSPHRVSVSFDVVTPPFSFGGRQTFTIRPGRNFAEYFHSLSSNLGGTSGSARGLRMVPVTAGSTSGLTEAMQANADDANGNRFVFASYNISADTTNGRFFIDTTTGGFFQPIMIGIVKNGSGAATNDTAVNVVLQWAPGVTQQSQVVIR